MDGGGQEEGRCQPVLLHQLSGWTDFLVFLKNIQLFSLIASPPPAEKMQILSNSDLFIYF